LLHFVTYLKRDPNFSPLFSLFYFVALLSLPWAFHLCLVLFRCTSQFRQSGTKEVHRRTFVAFRSLSEARVTSSFDSSLSLHFALQALRKESTVANHFVANRIFKRGPELLLPLSLCSLSLHLISFMLPDPSTGIILLYFVACRTL
jgi:hypothetical protein